MKKIIKRICVLLAVCAAARIFPAAADTDFMLPGGVAVHIVEAPFDKAQFKIDGCTPKDDHCLINDHIPYGVDGNLPHTYVKEITVTFQGKTYALDASDMYDAWNNRSFEIKTPKGVYRYFDGKCFKRACRFHGEFSDAAGSFNVEWRIVNGRPFRTSMTNGEVVDIDEGQ